MTIFLEQNLSPDELLRLCRRPYLPTAESGPEVRSICASVRRDGDTALRLYTRQFDGIQIDAFRVRPGE
ncbi:MAG: histidinol dehydrogenase, partial [Bacteroidota bacterium]